MLQALRLISASAAFLQAFEAESNVLTCSLPGRWIAMHCVSHPSTMYCAAMQDAMIDRLLADDMSSQSGFIISIPQLSITKDGQLDAPESPQSTTAIDPK